MAQHDAFGINPPAPEGSGLGQFGMTPEKLEKLKTISADPVAKEAFVQQLAETGPTPGAHPSDITPDAQQGFLPGGGVPENPGEPADRTPKSQEELDSNKGFWEEMLDRISDPSSESSALFQTGLNLLQPIQPGQSVGGHFAQSIGAGVAGLVEGRKNKAATARQGVLDTDKLATTKSQRDLAAAQTGKIGAETSLTGRKVKSLDFQDDLTQAQAELARAKAKSEKSGSKSAGSAKLALENIKVNAWFNAHPGKFVDQDDARTDLLKFEVTKGKNAYNDAMEALLQDLPVWKADKLKPLLELVKTESAAASERPTSPRQKTKVNIERLKKLSPEDWAAVKADPLKRAQLNKAFGEDVVNQFIAGGS